MNPLTHVAIIMDGNGRWGLKHKKSRNAGHKAGLNAIEKIIRETVKQKIKFLTLYAFSTENWKRPKKEINFLLNLLENFLSNRINDLHKRDIKLKIIGVKKFSKKLNNLLNFVEKKTSKNSKLQINLAISEIKNFDKIVRESCQLGVTKISCLESARSKFKNLLSTKKILRWEAISISACEQCGLNWKPEISSMTLNEWVENSSSENKILLNPKSSDTLKSIEASNSFDLAIGPEGGFSEEEIIFFEKMPSIFDIDN